MPSTKKETPHVFISSTVEGLAEYRQAARDAALRAVFQPRMMEYWAASASNPPYPECMAKVDETDLLVVIVAHRYGWIPPDQPEGGKKSITWLECERAKDNGKEILAFIVDPKVDWPEKDKETFRLTKAINEGKGNIPKLAIDVNASVQLLEKFKTWINNHVGIRKTFTTPDNLEKEIIHALYEWRKRNEKIVAIVKPRAAKKYYLQWLNVECSKMDIRGLQTGDEEAKSFGIEELYVPLKTLEKGGEERNAGKLRPVAQKAVENCTMFFIIRSPSSLVNQGPGKRLSFGASLFFYRKLCLALTLLPPKRNCN
ncbi:MAG: DUF4062 domain-containing protein [Actinobacteria bacterium]|nr:DUF4062 domain-containing protein [Actinomycetota bacterium]